MKIYLQSTNKYHQLDKYPNGKTLCGMNTFGLDTLVSNIKDFENTHEGIDNIINGVKCKKCFRKRS